MSGDDRDGRTNQRHGGRGPGPQFSTERPIGRVIRILYLDFRRFFERTLREEAPAHIHVRVCWVGHDQMALLDEKYRAWLGDKANKDFDQDELTKTARELIQILQRLKTVYPAATLHDCEEDEGDNPVRLDNTNLGVF